MNRILQAADISRPTSLEVDVCVIGSGAGGGAAAATLAEAGLSVAVVEKGRHLATEDFDVDPNAMSKAMYAELGLTAALGLPPVPIYYAESVGGTTTINSGTCFRTPAKVLASWSQYGLHNFSAELLAPWYERAERDLSVSAMPVERIGRNGILLHEARLALGLSGGVIPRNALACQGSGICCFGCPTGAKQSSLVSYIPRALAAGATVLADCQAERIRIKDGRAVAVEAHSLGGPDRSPSQPVLVKAKRIVIAGGAMLTPTLLHNSHIRPRALGRHLSVHPAIKIGAILEEKITPWEGIPQSYYIDEWQSEGFLIETIAVPPVVHAMGLPGFGAEHTRLMEALSHTAAWGAMISDQGEGRIRQSAGGPVVTYQLSHKDARAAQQALFRCAELAFAVGAKEVIIGLPGQPTIKRDGLKRLARRQVRPSDLEMVAFHPLGSCRMGVDPRRSVVDPRHQVHGVEDLYILDGSVFPTSLSVNPQLTIFATALRAAELIAHSMLN